MLKVWSMQETLSVPGCTYTVQKEYWVRVIVIPQRWWSLKEWRRANHFLEQLPNLTTGTR